MAKKHSILNNVSPLPSTEHNDSMSLSPSNDQPQQQQPAVPLMVPAPPTAKPMDKFSEDYCEICQKRFCNKYYLRKHKGECHGIYTDYIKSLQKSNTENPMKNRRPPSAVTVPTNTLLLNPFYPGPSDMKSLFPITSTSSSPLINDSNSLPRKASPQRSNRRCHLCAQEFRTKSLLRIHMTTVHGNENTLKSTLPASPLLSAANLGFLQPFLDTTSQLAQKVITGQTSQAPYGLVQDAYFCAKMADRVVCEICNKQVCNKYFLKTHKAKVHGITSNDPPEMSNENQIENSDTYCSICKKDFTTKYFYLFHMHTVHQDTSDPTYQTFLEFLKKASTLNESPTNLIEQFDAQANLSSNQTAVEDDEQQDEANDQDDETDSPSDRTSRKRSSSQSSNEQTSAAKRFNSLVEMNNGGLQPFLLESEDPKFSQTFVPCMVYLPVVRRVTKQVKINLRLKPVLTETAT